MASQFLVIIVAVTALVSLSAYAYDPSPLQDFCVAVSDPSAAVFVNGKVCKDPKLATTEDFLATGFNIPGNTSNVLGTAVLLVDVNRLPGLNTIGLSVVRTDYAPNGLIAPHSHPRAAETIIILEGHLYVGFVEARIRPNTTKKRLFAKVLNPGDVFVVPMGLIHFQLNVGKTSAVSIGAFNSQNPGVVTIANDVFGTEPSISPDVLTQAFQLDKKVVDYLQSLIWPGPNVMN